MATATQPLALNPNLAAGMTLSVSKTIRAPRARVFAAWTDPAILSQWFGPENATCDHVEVDLRVGGTYRIEMVIDGSRHTGAHGEYTQIVPDQKLQFTWHGCWRPDDTSLVTIAFRDSAETPGATDVTIFHERIAAEDAARGFEQGWTGCLNKLAAHLAH